jgi:hypothetical protein
MDDANREVLAPDVDNLDIPIGPLPLGVDDVDLFLVSSSLKKARPL